MTAKDELLPSTPSSARQDGADTFSGRRAVLIDRLGFYNLRLLMSVPTVAVSRTIAGTVRSAVGCFLAGFEQIFDGVLINH